MIENAELLAEGVSIHYILMPEGIYPLLSVLQSHLIRNNSRNIPFDNTNTL